MGSVSDNFTTPIQPHHSSGAEHDEQIRILIDESVAAPTVAYLAGAMVWLVVGSLFGALASLKFNLPDLLSSQAILTFGRIRPAHLNTVVYGWVSLAGAGVTVWLMGRLCRAPIQWTGLLYASVVVWNLGLLLGTGLILAGFSGGMEWLEFPLPAALLIATGFVLFAVSMFRTFMLRKVDHIYVSLWYILAALVWFPPLYIIANAGLYQGVSEAAMNWWFAHNLLTVWVTPIGLACAYYFIPKVIGRPIYSYYLGLLGFWTFALFYNWNGLHHLVGGPIPTWAVSLSIVASLLMFIPVITVAINHHLTAFRHLRMVKQSPTLRFVVFGAMCYTFVSVQGSLEATRTMQEVVHFTHYTVAHAHLGVYAFASMVLFGAVYYLMPRVMRWEWPYPGAIKVHFWTTSAGIALYFLAGTAGGWLQGEAMIDATQPFMNSVSVTLPYLWARSAGGILMTIGNVVFVWQFAVMVRRAGPLRFTSAWSRITSHEDTP